MSYRQLHGELTESGGARRECTLTWAISHMSCLGSPLYTSLGALREQERPYYEVIQKRERQCFRNPLHQEEDSRVRPPQGTGAGSLEVEKEVEQSPVSTLGQQQGAVPHPDCGISPTTRKEQDNWKILPLD